jgi:t-SNARE complex subunit (syntaxin)
MGGELMRFFRWLKNVMIGRQLQRRVNNFSRDLSKLSRQQKKNRRQLSERKNELDIIKAAVLEAEERLRETIDEALKIHKRYETQLEAANDRIKVMEEMTIPTLVQSNELLLERWRAETTVQVRRRTAFEKLGNNEEGSDQ